jgi:(p)ppGpp synthase/HD superfamily hydrolase
MPISNDVYWDAQVKLAKAIATAAHKGHVRKDGFTPQISHPEAVADNVLHIRAKCIAWLHDVLEDTDICGGELTSKGVDYNVISSLFVLTHQNEDTYFDYIRRIKSSLNKLALEVKVADLCCNIATLSSIPSISDQKFLLKRYVKAFYILTEVVE